ncbi:unnamed protein product, partial [Darwinula stevensoni]
NKRMEENTITKEEPKRPKARRRQKQLKKKPSSTTSNKGQWKVVQTKSGKKRKAEGNLVIPMELESAGEVTNGRPEFPPLKREKLVEKSEIRKVGVPARRYTPLRENWLKIFTPIVEYLKLKIRFNLKTRNVEIKASSYQYKFFFPSYCFPGNLNCLKKFSRFLKLMFMQSCPETPDITNLQRAADFVKAFILGFDVDDALALVRLDDLFVESFEIKDVKSLKGNHLSRAIGRVAGKGGKTKFAIENATKTRIVLADSKIHILGSYQNIQIARRAICNLILGSPPSKVYGTLRAMASRAAERF